MSRDLNPVFANRPQSIFPTMSALARAMALFVVMPFVIAWDDNERSNSAESPVFHALQNCSTFYYPMAYGCMSTSIQNLEQIVQPSDQSRKRSEKRLLAPHPYSSVARFPVKLRDEGGHESKGYLSTYVFSGPCNDSSAVAYLGLSDDANPLIEVESGVVEILEPDIKIGHQGARVVIDLTKKSIVSEYIAPRDYEPAYGFRFVNADEVYFAMGDSCITAPSLKPGMLRYAPRKCGALLGKDEHGHKNYYHGDEGLEPGHEGDVALAKKLIPWAAAYYGERLELRVHRIISQDLIVVNTVEACT